MDRTAHKVHLVQHLVLQQSAAAADVVITTIHLVDLVAQAVAALVMVVEAVIAQ
jgi:hypothetical protein